MAGSWWRVVAVGCVVAGCGGDGGTDSPATGGDAGSAGTDGGTATEGGGGTVAGSCTVFPSDNPWNRDVSKDPVDPNSDAYMAYMGADGAFIHPDWGSDPTYGIPYVVVGASQAKVPVTFQYADESDSGPYPIPLDAPIEGGPDATGDRHTLAIDSDACVLYELFDAHAGASAWQAGSGARFDLRSNALRPDGWTSADAAGLPIFPGLVRYDEAVEKGEIKHALRFTTRRTQAAFIHPATHAASSVTDAAAPPMGLRLRLKASFDASAYTGAAKAVLTALRTYGMFVADNGSSWFVSGASSTKWNDDEVGQLKKVPASAFEVVKADAILKNPP